MISPVTLDSVQAQLTELTEMVRQMRVAMPTPLVDIQAAAEFMGVSVRTVRRMVAKRQIVYRKVGRSVRFDLTALKPPRVAL